MVLSSVKGQCCHPQCNIDIYQNDWKVLQELRETVKYAVSYDSFNLVECFKLDTLTFPRNSDMVSLILQHVLYYKVLAGVTRVILYIINQIRINFVTLKYFRAHRLHLRIFVI